jgi:hypothetical protein
MEHKLKECQQAKTKVVRISKPVTIAEAAPVEVVEVYEVNSQREIKDTPLDPPFTGGKPQQLIYEREMVLPLQRDSTIVYLTLKNEIRENQLIQRVRLDSLTYPQKTIVITSTVPVEVDKSNYWKSIGIGVVVSAIILIIGFFVLIRRNKR